MLDKALDKVKDITDIEKIEIFLEEPLKVK